VSVRASIYSSPMPSGFSRSINTRENMLAQSCANRPLAIPELRYKTAPCMQTLPMLPGISRAGLSDAYAALHPARRRKPPTGSSQNGWSCGCQPDDRLPVRVSRATCDRLLCATIRPMSSVHEVWSEQTHPEI
jgi:hypothetical protein